ncbi:bacillithiol biosynthesis deacetylase BshB1 [Opitutaceae bacterium]
MKPTPTLLPESAWLLAFGAHPDDIEFGCGGVVARETQAGRSAHFVVCSRGESATHGTPDERTAEATAGATRLGATLEFADLGGDAHMEHKLAHVIAFAALIRRLRPSVLLAPTVVRNQHPDHAVVGSLVRDAARLARYGGVAELKAAPAHAISLLLYYAVAPEGEPTGATPLVVDVSPPPVVAAWTAAMEAHASQQRTRNYVELHLARARVLGLRAGVGHAMALFPNDPLVVGSLSELGPGARRF